MKNITYIIIFTLLLALGLIFTKIINYENITDELLLENIKQTNNIKSLESKNLTLNQTIINLQKDIQNIENNLSQERNNTQQLEEQIIQLESKLPFIDNMDSLDSTDTNITTEIEEYIEEPEIEENEITGFN